MKNQLFKISILGILSYGGKKGLHAKKLFLLFLFFFILGSGQEIDAKWNSPTVLKQLQEISGLQLLNTSFSYFKNTEIIYELDLGLLSKDYLITSYINKEKLNDDRSFIIKHLVKKETNDSFIENNNQEKLSDSSIDVEKEISQDTLQYDSANARILNIAPQNNLLMIIHLIVLVILLIFLLAHAKIKEQ